MACSLFVFKPLAEPILTYYHLQIWEQTTMKLSFKISPSLHSPPCLVPYLVWFAENCAMWLVTDILTRNAAKPPENFISNSNCCFGINLRKGDISQCTVAVGLGINWRTPAGCGSSFRNAISDHILQINFINISCKIDLRWMPQNAFDDMLTLIQVMACCLQATSQYLSQY